MKAIICVTGHDSVGIIASVSALCAKYGANIIDINQSVMEDYFTMVMMVDLTAATTDFGTLSNALAEKGKEMGLVIRIQREEIFDAMHRI